MSTTYIPDLSDQSTPLVKKWFTTRKALIQSYMETYNTRLKPLKDEPHMDDIIKRHWKIINEFHLQAHYAHKELCEREDTVAFQIAELEQEMNSLVDEWCAVVKAPVADDQRRRAVEDRATEVRTTINELKATL